MYKLVGTTTAVVAAHAPTPIPTFWAVVSPRFFFFGFAVVLVFFLTGLLRRAVEEEAGATFFTFFFFLVSGMLLGLFVYGTHIKIKRFRTAHDGFFFNVASYERVSD